MPRYLFPVAIMSTTFLKAVCSLPYISVMCCGEGREEREKGRRKGERKEKEGRKREEERAEEERGTEFGGVEEKGG